MPDPSNPRTRLSGRRQTAAITFACLFVAVAVLARRSQAEIGVLRWVGDTDYRQLTYPAERELLHARGIVRRTFGYMPHLEVRLDDGRIVLATFVAFPRGGANAPHLRDMGPFNPNLLPTLVDCPNADFGFLPIRNSKTQYWIYSVACSGVPLLSYGATMRYIIARKAHHNG